MAPQKPDLSQQPRRVFWFCIGALALLFAALGVVLPVVPTTPFVILAAFAFGNSSPRLQAWLENNKTFGPIIQDWRKHGAIAPRYKVISVGMMLIVLLISILAGLHIFIVIIQAICIAGAAVFILTRPSRRTG